MWPLPSFVLLVLSVHPLDSVFSFLLFVSFLLPQDLLIFPFWGGHFSHFILRLLFLSKYF